MYNAIKRYTRACIPCQLTKADNRPPKAPLIPMSEPSFPMQFICMDIHYMPEDDNGYKYNLLIEDLFSKYIEVIPIKDQLASTIAYALTERWILRHGCPLYLLTDQASNVRGNVINELCKTFGIKKRSASAYHSQGNGFAERNIRNVREVIQTTQNTRKLCQKSWTQLVNEVTFALNTTVSKAIKCTPSEVVHGRATSLSMDVKLPLSMFWLIFLLHGKWRKV